MSLLSASSAASANFQSIFDTALDSYARQTGIDLTKHSSADKLQNCHSPEDIIQLLSERETAFKDFRDKHRNLIDRLCPVVKVVHAFSGVPGGAAGLVPFQPTNLIFSAIDVLLSAAIGVTTSYDALLDLFECVANFLNRLNIYTERIPLSPTMSDVIVKIMAQVLAVLALATKQINQGRLKKFTKKLLGEDEVEAILQRLDRLTQEEARMTGAHTLDVVHGLLSNLKEVMDDGKASNAGIQQALAMMQEMTSRINKIERNLFQRDIRSWLFPPDPSTNHNIACRDHLDGTASWFIQSGMFKEWKGTGSFLWVYGKPGAGKSILCSSIIKEIEGFCNMGLGLMAYFYCDFRDPKKQEASGLLSSIIAQLAAKSDVCYNILSALYSECDGGSRQPGDHALLDCLETMLKTEGLLTIYIIIDGLDECPHISGVVPPRERVLQLVEDLVDLHCANLRICAASRPEADIKASLAPLASHTVSLHDEDGQRKDIDAYVRSVVYSDRHMRRWRVEDKEIVIDSLDKKGDGMFRWIVCQLQALRNCFPSGIRNALDDLPEGLDETYDRILLGIARERQQYARRLLHCISVSMRPLNVEELAEILAIKFVAGILPNYDVNWRPEDSEEAVLLACSSLITIVILNGSRVVQFSHYSVKEYLTSERLANAGKHLSWYHILPHSAHTILAQASLSVLLALDDQVDKESVTKYPFTVYAARYWVDHAQFDDVSSNIEEEMERLFDPSKSHFATWVWIYDIDCPFREILFSPRPTRLQTGPLYYATLCGFRGPVKHLIITFLQDVNACRGYYGNPLHAAVSKGNVDMTMLLLDHGADATAWNHNSKTPLHEATQRAHLDLMELLFKHHVDVDARDGDGMTPLYWATLDGKLDAARGLLRNGASVDSPDYDGGTPLEAASQIGHVEIARLLLQNGAAVDNRDKDGMTPLMLASCGGYADIVNLLLQSGSAVDARNKVGWTPLMFASREGYANIVKLLLQSGSAVDARNNAGWTPLMFACEYGHMDVIHLLLQADSNINEQTSCTPLHVASASGHLAVAELLIQRGADIDKRSPDGKTPLSLASGYGRIKIAHLLLESGSNVNSQDRDDSTPLHEAAHSGHLDIVALLLNSGADANIRNSKHRTPLDAARSNRKLDVERLLVDRTEDSQNGINLTPLNISTEGSFPDAEQPSVGQGEATYIPEGTSLLSASAEGKLEIVQALLDGGADVNDRDEFLRTALFMASEKGKLEVARLLIKYQAAVDSSSDFGWTPLHLASRAGYFDIVHLLLDHGAHVNAKMMGHWTALHLASYYGRVDVIKALLERGANAYERNEYGRTPFQLAAQIGHWEVMRLLSEHRAHGVVDG